MDGTGWIDLEGVANARDIGGLPTIDGRTTRRGVLLRTDNLQGVTPADLVRIRDELGVRTVLDLRTQGERHSEGPGPLADLVDHHDLSLVPHASRAGDADPDEADVERAVPIDHRQSSDDVNDMTGHYVGYVQDAPDNLATALRLLADPASGPTIVHCAAGKDRTGTVVAIALLLAGVTRDAVVADYVASAERIDDVLRSLQRSPSYGESLLGVTADMITPVAGSMERFLDHIDREYGGPHGLAMSIGLDEETVARLAARLVGPSR